MERIFHKGKPGLSLTTSPPARNAQPSVHQPEKWGIQAPSVNLLALWGCAFSQWALRLHCSSFPPVQAAPTASWWLQQEQREIQEHMGSRTQTAARKHPSCTFSVKDRACLHNQQPPVPVCKPKFQITMIYLPGAQWEFPWDRTEVSNLLLSSGASGLLPTMACFRVLVQKSVLCSRPSLTPWAASRQPLGWAVVLAEQPHISWRVSPLPGGSDCPHELGRSYGWRGFHSDRLSLWYPHSLYRGGRWHKLLGSNPLISSFRSLKKKKKRNILLLRKRSPSI